MEKSAKIPRQSMPMVVHVGTLAIECNGVPVDVTWSERKLAVAIGARQRETRTRTLAALLYPDRDEADGSNAVKVGVYRLRRRVSPDFVVRRVSGYALGDGVTVDLLQAERTIEQLRDRDAPIPSSEQAAILKQARELRTESATVGLDAEWWNSIASRAQRVGHDLALTIGRNALRQGDFRGACDVGHQLTEEDACDEDAWELLIGAYMHQGARAAAFRNYRTYETVLARELNVSPSAHIRRLVAGVSG